MKVQRYYDSGNEKYKIGNYLEAIYLFKKGIEELGDCYDTPGLLDDTGTKFLMAKSEERRQNLDNAAYSLRSVLRDRLLLYDKLNDVERKC
jgi:hypothetical protein